MSIECINIVCRQDVSIGGVDNGVHLLISKANYFLSALGHCELSPGDSPETTDSSNPHTVLWSHRGPINRGNKRIPVGTEVLKGWWGVRRADGRKEE